MAVVENRDGTLWIDIDGIAAVDRVRGVLLDLGVRVSAVVRDPSCDVAVTEVEWSDVYPRIVPRNGPEPGVVVDPAQIPEDRSLLLEACAMSGPGRNPETVIVLYLIDGPPPSRVGQVITRAAPRPPPGLRAAKPPPRI